MASEWRRQNVSDLIAAGKLVIGDGYRAKNSELSAHGLPFARAGNINDGFDFAGADCFPEEQLHRVGDKVSQAGDVVFTSKGTVGRFALVNSATPRFVYSPQLCFWRSRDSQVIDPRFLYYWMQGREFFTQYRSVAAQTDMAEYVNLADQRRMHITLPDIGRQRAMAEVLGSLDAKISLNRRTNETLASMVRALFDSWFIVFDPVRARSESRGLAGVSDDILALFPSTFVDSEIGRVPAGWRVTSLKDITSKIGSGATPRGGDRSYVDEGTAFIRSQNVYDSRFVWDGLARISPEAAEQLRGVTVQREDVLINLTGASMLRTCVVDPAVLPARVSQHVAIVRPVPGVPSVYIHQQLLRRDTKNFLRGMDAGGSRQAITKGHLESVRLVLPREDVLARFATVTGAMSDGVDANNAESNVLVRLRDSLLPRLLSGALRVRKAERTVEQVA